MKQLINIMLVGAFSLALVSGANANYKDTLDSLKRSVENDTTLGAHEIEFIIHNRSVILKGTVASEQARVRVVKIAKDTYGVKSVTDWLNVEGTEPMARYEAPRSRPDSEVAADLRNAIAADQSSLAERVSVSVVNGVATLKGDMKNFREIDQVLSTALMVPGVNDISSDMTINGHPYAMQKIVR